MRSLHADTNKYAYVYTDADFYTNANKYAYVYTDADFYTNANKYTYTTHRDGHICSAYCNGCCVSCGLPWR